MGFFFLQFSLSCLKVYVPKSSPPPNLLLSLLCVGAAEAFCPRSASLVSPVYQKSWLQGDPLLFPEAAEKILYFQL